MKRISFLLFALCIPAVSFTQASIRYKIPGQLLWGLKARSGNTVVPATYSSISHFKNGRYTVYKSASQIGLMDEYGKVLLPEVYSSIYDFDSVIQVRKNGKSGLLDKNLNEILPLQYEHLQRFDSFYIAKHEGKFGVLNPDFSIAIPFEHGIIYHNSVYSRSFLLYDNGKYALADIHNHILIPQEYEFLTGPQYGLYSGIIHGKVALFDLEGKQIIGPKYKDIVILGADDIALKNELNLWGIADRKGKVRLPFYYNKITAMSEGLYIVQNTKHLWGAVNTVNKAIIPFEYAEPFVFKNGLAAVRKPGGLFGYINDKGKQVIESKYDKANLFAGMYTQVQKNNLYGLIDQRGKEILPLQYDFVSVVIGHYVYATKNKVHYIIDLNLAGAKEGYEYIETADYLQRLSDDRPMPILARKNGKYGYIDINGKEIIPFLYDNAGSFIDEHASVIYNGEMLLIDINGNMLQE